MNRPQFTRPARRQPLVVLSLLLNVLLLGGSAVWWSGGGMLLGAPATQRGTAAQGAAPGFAACERPVLDEQRLEEWGCKVFHQACFDQDSLLLHSGEKTPNHPNFTHDLLFETFPVPAYVLPGYEEPLGTPHYTPKCWDLPIRGPTHLDPPDVWRPASFTNCTVPLVWWVTYLSVFADLYIGSALALDLMRGEGAFDRNVTLAPFTLGMDPPRWYQPLLEPFTRHPVQSISALSSREHLATGQPRCFERAVLCNLVGMYTASKTHHWSQLRPKSTGRHTVEHYRRHHPEKFLVHDRLAKAENGTVFRVAFQRRAKMRAIRNLDAAVQECKQWAPPADTPFKSVDCVLLPDGTPDNFADLLAQVQNVHALVNTHGSGNTFAFFMPNGSALVEILPWNFHGRGCTWADQYFSDWFLFDHTMHTGYFRLVADADHTFVGAYEKQGTGSSVAYSRDQDVTLDFPTLAKALEKIARGEIDTNPSNHGERTFFMTRRDICPSSVEAMQADKEKAEKAKAEKAAQEEGKGDGETQQGGSAAAADAQRGDEGVAAEEVAATTEERRAAEADVVRQVAAAKAAEQKAAAEAASAEAQPAAEEQAAQEEAAAAEAQRLAEEEAAAAEAKRAAEEEAAAAEAKRTAEEEAAAAEAKRAAEEAAAEEAAAAVVATEAQRVADDEIAQKIAAAKAAAQGRGGGASAEAKPQ